MSQGITNRIIVAGSRGFDDYALLDRKLTHILQRLTPDDTNNYFASKSGKRKDAHPAAPDA